MPKMPAVSRYFVAYLHRKATAWYKRFPPIHSPDRAEDPKTPQVDGCDGVGGSPDDEEDFEDRPVASESSSDELTTTRRGPAMKPDLHSFSWRFLI